MIKSSDIAKLLKDKYADLSKEEIEKIIEEELLKDESDMDADLIEYCLDALKEKEVTPKKKRFPYFKIASLIAAAAVLTFIITTTIPKLTDSNFNNKITVTSTSSEKEEETTAFYEITTENNTEKISASEKLSSDKVMTEIKPAQTLKEETTKPPASDKGFSTVAPEDNLEGALKKLLAANGFDSVSLPQSFFSNAEILNKNFNENKADIRIKSHEKIYDITIEKSSEKVEEKNTIDVNGINVSVESESNSSEIRYRKNNLNYRIVFESSYEEAVRVAKTIC